MPVQAKYSYPTHRHLEDSAFPMHEAWLHHNLPVGGYLQRSKCCLRRLRPHGIADFARQLQSVGSSRAQQYRAYAAAASLPLTNPIPTEAGPAQAPPIKQATYTVVLFHGTGCMSDSLNCAEAQSQDTESLM